MNYLLAFGWYIVSLTGGKNEECTGGFVNIQMFGNEIWMICFSSPVN
jgi:hypothetical protein